MRALRLLYAALLSALSLTAFAEEIPYCPPSLEAPLEEGDEGKVILFPRGHIFQPLLADPKESRFYMAYREYQRQTGRMGVGVIGFGENFPLMRKVGDCATDGVQVDITGGGIARFRLDDNSRDLLDADFRIAAPVSWRSGNVALRILLFHESSHLGEHSLFESIAPTRIRRSYEGLDVVASYDRETWRIYYGGGLFFNHQPPIEQSSWHVGAEYYSPRWYMLGGNARWVSGVDVKLHEEYDFEADVSIKAGLAFGGHRANQQHMQVLLEWYDGRANEGVIFEEEISYYGAVVYFGF
jgi:hypothetical protein